MLIVGLGNPGQKYAHTRHNVGWMAVDAFVEKHRGMWSTPSRLYQAAALRMAGKTVHVIKPLTYMNDSGIAVKQALAAYKLPTSQLLVVVDEFNFDVGQVSLKPRGSDGGHNGMASIIEELNTSEFWRLRLGISRDFGPGQLVDYVLADFPVSQQILVRTMLTAAVETIEECIRKRP